MRVAVLGTGLMGAPVALRLREAGHEVRAWNRTRAKAEALAPAGVEVADTPADALERSECVVLMLADADAIRHTLLEGPAPTALRGRSVIQMGTIAPQESRDLAEELHGHAAEYLEAPVLGSTPEAERGELIVMVGAEPPQFERWRELLAALGPEPRHIGPVGHAAAVKLALNQLIASLTAAFALSLGLVRREGLDVGTFMGILRESALYAPTFDKKLQRMTERQFGNPNFPVEHLLKDVRLFLREAEALGLDAATLEGCQDVLADALDRGLAGQDYSALYNVIDPKKN